jgi:hypothetical protein
MVEDPEDIVYLDKIRFKFSDKEFIMSQVSQMSDLEPLIKARYLEKLELLKRDLAPGIMDYISSLFHMGVEYKWYIVGGAVSVC